jgi:hypothetical protein
MSTGAAGLHTVCVFLGPYRNLTTLFASILHLHPTCQVLNHAGVRVLPKPSLNFLVGYTDEKFDRFCAFALEASQGGMSGATGGSIRLSHAFEHGEIGDAFRKRYGDALIKRRVESIVWKDPLIVSQLLRRKRIDVSHLFERNDKLRFLMPVRNPLDCARSNLETGFAETLVRSGDPNDPSHVVRAILEELAWFRRLTRETPDRFFDVFEFEVDRGALLRLADFLGLAPDERWIADALHCFRSEAHYEHGAELIQHYRMLVGELFADDRETASRLLRFAPVEQTPRGSGGPSSRQP